MVMMLSVLLSIAFVVSTIASIQAIDFSFDHVENINGTGEIVGKLTIKRINRTTYGLSGDFLLNPPFTMEPEKYYHLARFYLSSSGSSDFQLLPIRFPNTTFCDYVNTNYKKYFMETFHSVSNFPYTENLDENLCDKYRTNETLHFFVKDYVLDESTLPSYVPTGLFKVAMEFERDGNLVGGVNLFARIDNEVQ